MKFTISSKTMAAKLSSAYKVIPQRSPLPILNNFLLSVKDGLLSITAYDTEHQLVTSASVMDSEDGQTCIDAQFLLNLIKTLPEIPINFSVTGDVCEISTPNGKYTTSAVSVENFPSPEHESQWDCEFTVPAAALSCALSTAVMFTSEDDFKQALMGVEIKSCADTLQIVATDTFRLAKKVLDLAVGSESSFIISKKAVAIICNIASGDVILRKSEKFLEMMGDGFILRSQLIKGNYPNVNRVIPTTFYGTLTIDRHALLSAVRRASVCAGQEFPRVEMEISENAVNIKAVDSGMGRNAAETLPCSLTGTPMKIGFQSKFLSDVLSALTGENIEMKLIDSSRPCLFTSTDEESKGLTMLLMPSNI